MYELWIKRSNGEWAMADLPKEMPVMFYQGNDLAELNIVKSNASYRIHLPITKTNCEIFDYINEFDVVSDIPYRKLDCRLYCNDISLSPGGPLPESTTKLYILRVTDESFEVQVVGSMMNIYKWLEYLKFIDNEDEGFMFPDLGSYVREKKVPTSSIIQEGVGIGAIASVMDSLVLNKETFTTDRAVPYVKFKMMLDWVEQMYGLKFICDIPNLDNIATLVTGIELDENSLRPYIGTAEQSREYTPQGGRPIKWGDITDNANGNLYVDDQESTMLYYNTPFGGSCIFEASDYASIRTLGTLEIVNLATSTEVKQSFSYTSGPAAIKIEFSKGDKIRIRVLNGSSSNAPLENVRLTMHSLNTNNQTVPIGGIVSIRENLGFKNFKEYLKAMLEALGLFIDYDPTKHIMYLVTADYIYKNREKAIDWTSKLHNSRKGSTSYTSLDYARSNTINFEDDKNTGFKDSLTFYVDNENLKEHKDLFKLKFEAGDNADILANWTIDGKTEEQNCLSAIVPLYKVEDNELTFIGSGKPRIVFIDNKVNLVVNGISFPHILNAKADEIERTYFDKLINGLLKKSKTREDEFYLTAQDIEEYNQFIPIYLHQYGAYFYINIIKNFVDNTNITCELIQL